MLNTLQIKNVALISELEVEFNEGFNVLLGETGAGKSIIFDALNFVLGYKADKTLIRNGEQQMKVVAQFSSNSTEIKSLLNGYDIEFDGNLLLSRNLNISGKSECRINGEVVTVGMLKQIGGLLLDTYGQHENQLLLKTKNYLNILDLYCGDSVLEIKSNLKLLCEKISLINSEIESLGGSNENRETKIDFLRYQINEIKSANLKDNEDEEIKEILIKASNQEKVSKGISEAIDLFSSQNTNAIANLKTGNRLLQSIESFDSSLLELTKRIESSIYEIEDVVSSLNNILENYVFDENEIDILIARQDLINSLKRKYGGSIKSVQDSLILFEEELCKLENSEEILQRKNIEKEKLIKEYFYLANNLSEIRKAAALVLEKEIIKQLSEVGMKNSVLKVTFNSEDKISENGLDEIDFLFSANLGEDLKPLAKTISGGEMSRFMLVFKNVLASKGEIETLVFDEIDSGISGITASSVAEKIASLSKTNQVLCITHLPQVASMADNFYYVAKNVYEDRTVSTIQKLEEFEISEKLAIMTAGENVNKTTKDYIEELLQSSNKYKLSLNN